MKFVTHYQSASGMDGRYDTACGWHGVSTDRIAWGAFATCRDCIKWLSSHGDSDDPLREMIMYDLVRRAPEPGFAEIWARETEATGL